MVTVGLVRELTAEAARQAALGAGARLLACFAQRLTAADVAAIEGLRDVFGAMLKFPGVRNPWDRTVSLDHRQLRRSINRKHKDRRRDPRRFAEYIRWEPSRIGSKPGVTQSDMISIDNNIGIHRILRFESLAEDWARLMARLGI